MRVLSQPNRCALLESARVPGHLVIFDRHGKITNESSAGYADLSKEFVVFVKVNWREVIKADTAKLVFSFALLWKTLKWSHNGEIRSLSTWGIDACGHFVHPECGPRDGSLSKTKMMGVTANISWICRLKLWLWGFQIKRESYIWEWNKSIFNFSNS